MNYGNPLRLIVHGDDFGLSEAINEGIRCAHRHGILTSASVVAVGEAFREAVGICRTLPSLDLGIHLTLVEEKPLLPPPSVPSLLAPNGRFHRHAKVFTARYLRGQIDLQEVQLELAAQIERALATGLPVTHLDSHQHLHLLPGILEVVLELAERYGIRLVRFPTEKLASYMLQLPRGLSRVVYQLVLNVLCRRARQWKWRTDCSLGFFFAGQLDRTNLKILIDHLPGDGTAELICHPGSHDPQSPYRHWGYHWTKELEALVDPEIRRLLQTRNVQLISYRDLMAREL